MTNDQAPMTNQAPMINVQMNLQRPFWSLGLGHFLVIGIWSLGLSIAKADSIFVGSLERKDVTIRDIKGDTLIFDINGRQTETQASKVTRLTVTSEPPLNAAEEAYAAGKWDQAVDGYQKTLRTTQKPWVKEWAATRLIDAGNKSGRFDAAVSAYIQMLLKDPASAAGAKPSMPDAKSTYLDTAVKEVNTALGDSKLTVDQKRALLGFLVELQQARKDAAAEDDAYERLAKLPGADVNDSNARRVLAKRKISVASRALETKNYRQALDEVEKNRGLFTEPTQQADALFIIAEARHALAGSDNNALKDAALGYMRVVAAAKNEPGRPHVVDSLLKTAAILEQLGEPRAATGLYEQVLAQFADDPSAPKARDNLERLKKQAAAN
jgi:tetratricopeptide (TPR) repeat protein